MLAIAKVLMVALALTGVGGTGMAAGVVHVPMQKAIDIHNSHLGRNSTMPEQSQNGQHNSLYHLLLNQQRFLSNHNGIHVPDSNDTEQNETN